jgi:hypothetical protein
MSKPRDGQVSKLTGKTIFERCVNNSSVTRDWALGVNQPSWILERPLPFAEPLAFLATMEGPEWQISRSLRGLPAVAAHVDV